MPKGAAPARSLSVPELVAMVAALSALNALSIDIMLPALPLMGALMSGFMRNIAARIAGM